jgi:hypothetical protein
MKSMAERIRNERVKALYLQREKASQIKDKGVNNEKPRYLTQEQMDKVKDLQREKSLTREEAVKIVLGNIK